jgi:hypothetical protein
MRLMTVTAVVVFACISCGDDRRPAPSPLSPTSVNVFEGTWTGTTSQSERFAFVVTGNFLSRLEFSGSYTDGSCVGGFSAIQTFGPSVVISDSQFSASSTNPLGTVSWSVSGRFVSPTTASGTLQVTATPATPPSVPSNCPGRNIQVTWTAQKI